MIQAIWLIQAEWCICVSKLVIASDNGLSSGRRQAIILANTAILLIERLGTNFNEIQSQIHILSFKENAFEKFVCEIMSP